MQIRTKHDHENEPRHQGNADSDRPVFSIPWIGSSTFYIVYAYAIGIALVLVVVALVIFPAILNDISDAAKLAYANSTLKGIDVEAKLETLERLMTKDKRSSVLSVGMTCGFGSQSTFYAAFREITGESPAAFRKKSGERPAPSD